MRKHFPHISTFILTFVLVLVVSGFIFPQMVVAQSPGTPGGIGSTQSTNPAVQAGSGNIFSFLNPTTWIPGALAAIVNLILKFVALLTGLAGVILNGVIYYTVVNVSDNYTKLTSINVAWGVIRDVANMAFIFVLLYAAIQTILGVGKDNKQLIVRIVVVAILINFSLFFTKVIIDVSNVLALTFYEASVGQGVASAGFTGAGSRGLSNAFMQELNLQGLYKAADKGNIGIGTIITTGIMGTIVLLIAAFIFFAVAIMFIIRYVVLILVLILSPIAFIAYILPSGTGVDKYKNDWKNALLGQAFFAPIYFILTWITLRILGGITSTGVFKASGTISNVSGLGITETGTVTGVDPGFFGTFINFAVVIVFLVVSLIIAKEWANKAGGGVAGLTKWATGVAGGASFGLAGRVGRGTVGRVGQAVADSQWLKERAPDSRMARLALAAGKKTGVAGFDLRGTPLTSNLEAGSASGKGGYQAEREARVKKRMSFARDVQDVITGDHVENEMDNRRWTSQVDQAFLQNTVGLTAAQIATINAGGASKNQMEALGINALQAEHMRRRVQADLISASTIENATRQDRYLHSLSQTHWYTPNLYAGVSEDAEAARRLRAGQRSRTPEQQQAQDTAEAIADALRAAGVGGASQAPPPPPQQPPAPPNQPNQPPPPPPGWAPGLPGGNIIVPP